MIRVLTGVSILHGGRCFAALALLPLSLHGQTVTWDAGGGDDDWSTAQNWVGNTVPSSGVTNIVFDAGSSANNDLGSFTTAEINFSSNLGATNFNVTGDRIVFSGTHDIDVFNSGTNTIFNDITSSSNLQIRGNNNGTVVLAGDITGGFITKFDNSTLVLSGNNAFTNRIRIRGGTVESTSANGLGGANRIDFEDDQGGSNSQTPTLHISTVSQSYDGTLRAESGDTGYIDVDSGLTFTVTGSGTGLDWDSSSSGFVKQGGGTLLLEKNATGDGTMLIEEGTVRISTATALGGTNNGTTVQSGGALELAGGITFNNETLTLAGSGVNGNGALANQSGNNTWNANINLSGNATISNNAGGTTLTLDSTKTITNGGFTTTFGGAGDIAADSVITGAGGVAKTGTGTTTLSATNTYTGATTVSNGTLAITNAAALGGTGTGTTVQSGGTLGLSGGITVADENLTLAGSGYNGNGALANQSGSNTWDSDITLSGDTTITNDATGTTLTIGASGAETTFDNAGNTLTIDGAGDTLFNSQFTGTGGLVKNGSGTARLFYGQNDNISTYSGPTTVNEGTLIADLGDNAFNATPLTGTITVGDGVGVDTFRVQWFDNVGDNTTVNVNSSGVFEINSATYNEALAERIGALNLQGGATVQTVDGSGAQASVILGGDVTRVATGNTTANITGRLDLGGGNRNFNVADSGAANDLDVSAQVSNGSLIKNGAGTMTLSGSTANTITSTTVNAGTLTLNKTAGVNAVSGNVVVNGGTLLLGASNQIADGTTLDLAGGTFGTQGNSEALGSLTLSGSSTIDLGSGGVLSFDASSGETWSGSVVVTNWDGDQNGGGSNQLIFGSTSGGLSSGQVNQIFFVNPAGFAPGTYTAKILSSGEIVPFTPIPEPGTIISGIVLVLGAGFHGWRRWKKAKET